MGRPSGWYVSYASLIGFTLAGLKAYEWGWAPAQRTWYKRTFFLVVHTSAQKQIDWQLKTYLFSSSKPVKAKSSVQMRILSPVFSDLSSFTTRSLAFVLRTVINRTTQQKQWNRRQVMTKRKIMSLEKKWLFSWIDSVWWKSLSVCSYLLAISVQ